MKTRKKTTKILSAFLSLIMIVSIMLPSMSVAAKEYTNPFTYDESALPEPVLDSHPEWIELYYNTWKIAQKKVQFGTNENGFVDAYMDEGFSSYFYLWDTAYIVLFGKYSNEEFPSIVSMENLYRKQDSDGFIGKAYKESDGNCILPKTDPYSRNPPLLAWTEWECYKITGDSDRFLKEITANQYDDSTKTILQRLVDYYYWMKDNNRYENGFYWTSTGGSGMTGSPRLGAYGSSSTGDGSWICLSGQMALSAKCIADMAKTLGDDNTYKRFTKEYEELSYIINTYFWDEETGFYYDLDKYGNFYDLKSPAAFWPVIAGVASKEQVSRMIDYLLDPEVFNTLHMIPSVAANESVYNPALKWNGDTWAPMVYMVAEAMNAYGYKDIARLIAENHVTNLTEIYNDTGTLWEKYNSSKLAAGSDSKQDFTGWTGLGPTAMLIEDIIGLEMDAPSNTVTWDLSQTCRNGLKNFTFGDVKASVIAEERKNADNAASITVTANKPFTLIVKIGGVDYTINAEAGEHVYNVGEKALEAESFVTPLYSPHGKFYLSNSNGMTVPSDKENQMELNDIGGGFYTIKDTESGQYMSVTASGSVIFTDNIDRNAKFQFCNTEGNSYILRSLFNGNLVSYNGNTFTASSSDFKDLYTIFVPDTGEVEPIRKMTIISLETEYITTSAGTAPILPNFVTAVCSDASSCAVPVIWDSFDWNTLEDNQTVTLYGTVDGSDIRATAEVTALNAAGKLSGTYTESEQQTSLGKYSVDFTKAGTIDWAHFGSPNYKYTSHKKNGGGLISDIKTGSNAGYEDPKNQMPLSVYWSDGSVAETVNGEKGCWWNKSSASFTIEASEKERRATIYAYIKTGGEFDITATLLDSEGNAVESVAPYTLRIDKHSSNYYALAKIELDIQSVSSYGNGQKVQVDWKINNPGTGLMFGIYGVTLADSDNIPTDILPEEPVATPLTVNSAPIVTNLSVSGYKDWIHPMSDLTSFDGGDTVPYARKQGNQYLTFAPVGGAITLDGDAGQYSYWDNGTDPEFAECIKNGARSSGPECGWNISSVVRANDVIGINFSSGSAVNINVKSGDNVIASASTDKEGVHTALFSVDENADYNNISIELLPAEPDENSYITLISAVMQGSQLPDHNIDITFNGNTASKSINLTETGTKDWIQVGGDNSSNSKAVNRKALVKQNIGLEIIGTATTNNVFVDAAYKMTWTDGSVFSSGTDVTKGVNWRNTDNGVAYKLTSTLEPGDTFEIYLGRYKAGALTEIYINDDAEPLFSQNHELNTSSYTDTLTIINNESAPIDVSVIRTQTAGGSNGNIFLLAATLAGDNVEYDYSDRTQECERLYNMMKQLRIDRYTDELAEEIKTSMKTAEDIINSESHESSELLNAISAMKSAFDKTYSSDNIKPVDKSALSDAVNDAKSYMSELLAKGVSYDVLKDYSYNIDTAIYDGINSRYATNADVEQMISDITASKPTGSLSAPESAVQNEYFELSVITLEPVSKFNIYNESGKKITNKILSSTDNGDGSYTSIVTLRVGTPGDVRTFTVANGESLIGSFSMRIEKYVVSDGIVSVSAPETASVNESFSVKAVTTSNLIKFRFENESGSKVGAVRVARTINGQYAESIYDISVGTAGERNLKFKADYDKCSEWPFETEFNILITK